MKKEVEIFLLNLKLSLNLKKGLIDADMNINTGIIGEDHIEELQEDINNIGRKIYDWLEKK